MARVIPSRLEPVCAEVEEGEDQHEEEDGAIDTGSMQSIAAAEEEENIDWSGVGAARMLANVAAKNRRQYVQEKDKVEGPEAEHGGL